MRHFQLTCIPPPPGYTPTPHSGDPPRPLADTSNYASHRPKLKTNGHFTSFMQTRSENYFAGPVSEGSATAQSAKAGALAHTGECSGCSGTGFFSVVVVCC